MSSTNFNLHKQELKMDGNPETRHQATSWIDDGQGIVTSHYKFISIQEKKKIMFNYWA